MTVGEAGDKKGVLARVERYEMKDGIAKPEFKYEFGHINQNLTIGLDLTSAKILEANSNLAFAGMAVNGKGFVITPEQAQEMGLGSVSRLNQYIRPYRNGKDIVGISRNRMVIDLYGLSIGEVQERFPKVYDWLCEKVKPIRDNNRDEPVKKNWWLFGRPRPELRDALSALPRYIVTTHTSKHRLFTFLDNGIIPDASINVIASDDAYHLGILSSRIHSLWADATGGMRGDTNVYNKTASFDAFPFPDVSGDKVKNLIRELAEQINTHRREMQDKYPRLTLTQIYNLVEKIRYPDDYDVSDKESEYYQDAENLNDLHNALDAAVFEAYGWPRDLLKDEILKHLLNLNNERANEEKAGEIRWLKSESKILKQQPARKQMKKGA